MVGVGHNQVLVTRVKNVRVNSKDISSQCRNMHLCSLLLLVLRRKSGSGILKSKPVYEFFMRNSGPTLLVKLMCVLCVG